jgi:8-oxo-dGTP diphosphatase
VERKVGELYGGKLRVRVCGLLERDGFLLLARHDGVGPAGQLWLPPGGGLEFGESAQACLVREFQEECGIKVHVGPFYHLNELLDLPLHAIELFYRVTLLSGAPVLGTDPEQTDGPPVLAELKWFSKDQILGYKKDAMHAVALRWARESS